VTEDQEERAAIREYLGGYSRAEAERLAVDDVGAPPDWRLDAVRQLMLGLDGAA